MVLVSYKYVKEREGGRRNAEDYSIYILFPQFCQSGRKIKGLKEKWMWISSSGINP
jgi:hypothetical protein